MADNNKVKSIGNFKKTVAVAGTAEQLSTDHKLVQWVVIQGLKGNTGYTAIGDSSVDESADVGVLLSATGSVPLENVYLDEIYVDTDTNGDGVSVLYGEAYTY